MVKGNQLRNEERVMNRCGLGQNSKLGKVYSCILIGLGGTISILHGQEVRNSLAGEKAAHDLKQSIQAEQYNIQYGPMRFQTEAGVQFGYNDNVFQSEHDRRDDFIISPQVILRSLFPVTEQNTLRLSIGLGYEWYAKNSEL